MSFDPKAPRGRRRYLPAACPLLDGNVLKSLRRCADHEWGVSWAERGIARVLVTRGLAERGGRHGGSDLVRITAVGRLALRTHEATARSLVAEYEEGTSLAELTARMGVEQSRMWRWLRAWGASIRPRGWRGRRRGRAAA